MLSGSTISSNLGKWTIMIDSTNFMAVSENSLGVWTTRLYFSEGDVFDGSYVIHWDVAMMFLIVEPAQLFKNIFPANS